MKQKSTIWTKDFILACAAALFTNICMRMLDSNLASFASVAWDSKTLGGYLTSMFNVGSIAMAFFAGRMVDLKGRKNCLIFGSLLFGIPSFALFFTDAPAVALAVRLIQGIAKGIVTVASAAIVSDVIPRDRMNEGMGFYNLGGTISFAFGPMMGLALVAQGGYSTMFLVCAALYTVSAFFGIGITYEKKQPTAVPATEKAAAAPTKEYRGVWKLIEKKALLPSFVYTLFFGGYACILVFLTVYAQEQLLLDSTQIGLFYTVAAVAMLVVRLTCGKLADKFGALCMVVPGQLAMIGALAVLAFFAKGSYPMFLVSGALYGLGNAAVMPALNAVAVVDSPKDRSATANATFYFMMDFGILFASAGFGALIDAAPDAATGYHNTFLISMGILALALVLSVLLFNNKARARRRAAA